MSSSKVINMNEMLMSGLNKLIGVIVCEAVMHCGSVHNFDGWEMIRSMNLEEMCVSVSSKSSKSSKSGKALKVKKAKECVVKSKFPMPFNGSLKEGCCSALRQNQGLYTQCDTAVSESDFCKKCGPSAIYGTIQQRLEVGIMEFRDPKGKAPTPFAKIMKKLKISREEVVEEAEKLNIIINDIHFIEEAPVEKKEKGRPKKPRRKIELADDSTDLFAALVAKANEDSEEDMSDLSCDEKSSMAESILDSVLDKVSVISENNEKKAEKEAEKLAAKAAKDAEKEAKDAEKAEKLAAKAAKDAEKAEKDAEKAAEKAAKDAEKAAEKAAKDAEKAAEKAAKDAEKAAEKAAKDAEKEAAKLAQIQKKELEKAEKEAAKLAQIQKKESDKKPVAVKATAVKPAVVKAVEVKAAVVKSTKAVKATKVEEEEEDVVKRFEFEGVKYLKSKKTGIIYNMEQDVIGKWNEKTSKIDFEEADSEEEEDEYDA